MRIPTDRAFGPSGPDVILLTADEVEIPAHKCILSAASPFFEHMFGLPQPQTLKDLTTDKIPIIPISEHSSVMCTLVCYVYPEPDPVISSLDDLSSLLDAAVKYDFDGATSRLRKYLTLPEFVRENPLRAFAIANRYELDYEARVASKYTLSVNVLDCPLSDDLKFITAYSYHRLLNLHRQRSIAARKLLELPEDVKCMQCNGGAYYANFIPPKWWREFERMASEELAVRPTTEVIFSMEFMSKVVEATGCPRCAGSILCAHRFLMDLKSQIDELPATI